MKLRELQAFEAYMLHGSTKSAAEALGVGQPLVSKLLTSLEKKAGFQLFDRKRNQLVPTPEARLFHASVTRHLAKYRDLLTEAEAIANKQRGNVVVAAQPVFCDTFLVDTVARFKRAYPDVTVRLLDVGQEELLGMIAERSCDLGLGVTLETGKIYGATISSLGRCEALCALPKGHELDQPGAIPLPRIRNEPFVDLPPGSPLRTRIDNLMASIEVRRTIAAEMRTLRGVCSQVAAGTGVAIIDPLATLLTDGRRVVTKPLIPTIDWEIALFHPDDRPLSAVAQTFLKTLQTDVEKLKRRGLIS